MTRRRMQPRSPGYLGKLLVLGESLKSGTVTHVTVLHDDWCPRLQDPPGECECDADIAPL